jgi:hypothetical protein
VAVVTLRRCVGWGCAVIVVIVAVRVVAGPWVAAGVLAVAVMVGLIAAWAAVEGCTFGRDPRSPAVAVVVPERAGPSTVEHLAYARALAVVVASYVAECEREAGLR